MLGVPAVAELAVLATILTPINTVFAPVLAEVTTIFAPFDAVFTLLGRTDYAIVASVLTQLTAIFPTLDAVLALLRSPFGAAVLALLLSRLSLFGRPHPLRQGARFATNFTLGLTLFALLRRRPWLFGIAGFTTLLSLFALGRRSRPRRSGCLSLGLPFLTAFLALRIGDAGFPTTHCGLACLALLSLFC